MSKNQLYPTQPARGEVARNLAAASADIPGDRIRDVNAAIQPALLNDADLKQMTAQLKKDRGNAEVYQPLLNHAAAWLRKMLPNAVFPGDPELPSTASFQTVKEVRKSWKPTSGKFDNGLDYIPPDAPTPAEAVKLKKFTDKSFQTISIQEHTRLWAVRNAAAERFDAVYHETGVFPPSPRIDSFEDVDEQLAEIEGWHDCASRYPAVHGTMYVDYLTGEDRVSERLRLKGLSPPVPQELK